MCYTCLKIIRNLVSMSQLTIHNNQCVEFNSDSFCVKDKTTKTVMLKGKSKDDMYVVDSKSHPQYHFTSAPQAFLTDQNHNKILVD